MRCNDALTRLLGALLCGAWLASAAAQEPAPHAIDIPAWFAETFLDLREDIREAAGQGKRVMLYFGQDGCPYCKELMQTNFSQRAIADKTRRHFVAVAFNIWGDREVIGLDGKKTSEKEFARALKVQFTPTLLFFDEQGNIVARLNGYYPPHRFEAVLDYVAGRMETKLALGQYMKTAVRESASGTLHHEPFFLPAPLALKRRPGDKPLAVLFETRHCAGCDELHREGFRRPEVKNLLPRFDMVRFTLADRSEITTADGRKTTVEKWARELQISYTPTLVFFEPSGREVFRVEAYLRPFHLASSLEYVASGAYRTEPSFQRFIQARAERMRAQGRRVELWQ